MNAPSISETIWTLTALLGVAVTALALHDAWLTRRRLCAAGVHGALCYWSAVRVRQEAIRVVVQLGFLVAAASAIAIPNVDHQDHVGWRVAILVALVGAEWLVVLNSVLDWRARRVVIGRLGDDVDVMEMEGADPWI